MKLLWQFYLCLFGKRVGELIASDNARSVDWYEHYKVGQCNSLTIQTSSISSPPSDIGLFTSAFTFHTLVFGFLTFIPILIPFTLNISVFLCIWLCVADIKHTS